MMVMQVEVLMQLLLQVHHLYGQLQQVSLGSAAGNFSGTVATVAATSDSAIAYSEVSSPAVLIGSGSGQAKLCIK